MLLMLAHAIEKKSHLLFIYTRYHSRCKSQQVL